MKLNLRNNNPGRLSLALFLFWCTCSCETLPVISGERILFTHPNISVRVKSSDFNLATSSQINDLGFRVSCKNSEGEILFNERAILNEGYFQPESRDYYYPRNQAVDFYAVFPPSYNITQKEEDSCVEYKQDQRCDLMVAEALQIHSSDKAVQLDFKHVLSLIHIRIVEDEGPMKLKLISLEMRTADHGVYNMAEDHWTVSGETTSIILKDGCTYSIIPGNPVICAEWELCDPDDDENRIVKYYSEQPFPNAFESGKECTVTLQFSTAAPEEIVLSCNVKQWETTEILPEFD